jgi:hypothetical protein
VLVGTAGADERVDRLLLAHDDVLEPVLERLGVAGVAGGGDRVLQRLDRLGLQLDQAGDDGVAVVRQPEALDAVDRLAAERSWSGSALPRRSSARSTSSGSLSMVRGVLLRKPRDLRRGVPLRLLTLRRETAMLGA